MGRKLSKRECIRRVCGRVLLEQLPQLPESLHEMVVNGRKGALLKTDLKQLKQWAEDLQKYAAEFGLYAEVASKHDYLRVHYFIYDPEDPPALHVIGPKPLELLGDALETCSNTASYRRPQKRKALARSNTRPRTSTSAANQPMRLLA